MSDFHCWGYKPIFPLYTYPFRRGFMGFHVTLDKGRGLRSVTFSFTGGGGGDRARIYWKLLANRFKFNVCYNL